MKHEVQQAILDTPKGKAPGEDIILNSILYSLEPVIMPYLTSLFNTCVWLGYNPSYFQMSIIVVLRKMGKKNYWIPKAYQPIVLLNTISKALKLVIAHRISYIVKTHNILLPTYLGGCKGISTEHTILYLIDWIQ